MLCWRGGGETTVSPPSLEPLPAAADSEQVHQLCAACHAYPPAESFPRSAWREEVQRAYGFFRASDLRADYPSMESVVRYYEERAPRELPPLDRGPAPDRPPSVQLESFGLSTPGRSGPPGVTNVQLAHLSDPKKLDVLVCQRQPGGIWAVKLDETPPAWRRLGQVMAPAHVEAIDLDNDGHKDLLVADLGNFFPTDDRVGRVVWLRNDGKGNFNAVTLLEGVGRVADVRTADFNGDGKLDLVVAVFGWHRTGEILYLENHTTDWSRPNFTRQVLDRRPGAIHVPIGDIDGDGKPDIVALMSQEFETVVALLNQGDGRFQAKMIFEAPHPAYGSSGIQLVDLNGDDRLDVLYSNGDILDRPYLLKPYHGVRWLENRGRFPFVSHPLAGLYGAMRTVAANVDGDGDLDVLAVSFLPPEWFPQRTQVGAESVLLLEQTAPGKFQRHVLEVENCDHLTCAAGDLFGDGRIHFVTGNCFLTADSARGEALTLWKNKGPRKTGTPPSADR